MNTNPKAKRILVYGDSIAWGRDRNTLNRLPVNQRYTGVTQQELGTAYEIIEENLRGRLAYGDSIKYSDKNGYKQFTPILLSHLPVDIVLLAVGFNDLQLKECQPSDIASNLEKYFTLIQDSAEKYQVDKPKVAFITQPIIREEHLNDYTVFKGCGEKSKLLTEEIFSMSKNHKISCFRASDYVKACFEDGAHIDANSHQIFGIELAKFIKQIFQND